MCCNTTPAEAGATSSKKKYVDKRDWKAYENNLIERKKKVVQFFLKKPTKQELQEELDEMNEGKRGRQFLIPDSVINFFHFMKCNFRIDDRVLILKLSSFLSTIMGSEREFDHSTIVKRRKNMDLDMPFRITPENIRGKTLYGDGMCLRLGRGGYYRSKRYETDVDYVRVVVFTDDKGNALDFVIGDEHDAEINLIREKMPDVIKSKPKKMNFDGAASSHDIVEILTVNRIKPVIPASKTAIASIKNKPPPEVCIRKKKEKDLIWEAYLKEQKDYQQWRKNTDYSDRWVHSEGRFSVFKRMFGEELLCRTQKGIHDEVCIKMMIMNGDLPKIWG